MTGDVVAQLKVPAPILTQRAAVEFFRDDDHRRKDLPESCIFALRHFSPETTGATILKGLLDLQDGISDKSHSRVVLPYRKATCLAFLLKLSGFPFASDLKLTSDRFILLSDPRFWKNVRHISICDDTWNTGDELTARSERIADLINQWNEESDVNIESVEARALINVSSLSSHESLNWRANNQRVFARTLAEGGVPFYTDFPITEEFLYPRETLRDWIAALDPQAVNVSNAAYSDVRTQAWSVKFDVDKLLSKDSLLDQLKRITHVIKLRVFERRESYDSFTPEHDSRNCRVRIMPKVILKPVRVSTLKKIAKILGFDERRQCVADAGRRTTSFDEQLHCYIEYKLAERVFSKLKDRLTNKLRDMDKRRDGERFNRIDVDSDLKRLVLDVVEGTSVQDKGNADVKQNGAADPLDEVINLIARDYNTIGEAEGSSFDAHSEVHISNGLWQMGDEIPQLVETHIDKLIERDRVEFHKLAQDAGLAERAYVFSLALDVLNDLGRIVPGQSVFADRSGELWVARSYRHSEDSFPLPLLSESRMGGKLAQLSENLGMFDEKLKIFELLKSSGGVED